MPTIKHSLEKNFVDMATGQIVRSEERILKSWSDEPPFIKLYLQDILFLSDLPKGHNAVLSSLLKRAGWASENGMEISLTAGTKRLMLRELGLKNIRTINNALSDFVRAKILYRVETGVYRFNPYLFGKGDWQDISKLRLTVDYSIQGKTFGSAIAYASQQEEQLTLDQAINEKNAPKGSQASQNGKYKQGRRTRQAKKAENVASRHAKHPTKRTGQNSAKNKNNNGAKNINEP